MEHKKVEQTLFDKIMRYINIILCLTNLVGLFVCSYIMFNEMHLRNEQEKYIEQINERQKFIEFELENINKQIYKNDTIYINISKFK